MFIIKHKTFFFIFSGVLTALSMCAMFVFLPWNIGIEFTGGTLFEVGYPSGRPDVGVIQERVTELGWPGTMVQAAGDDGLIIRTKDITEAERQELVRAITLDGASAIEERRFTSIGPTIGAELRNKAWIAIALVIVAIILYIAFAFRHVSHPVSSWVYGLVAIIALIHDVIIPTGIYVALGHYMIDMQIDVLFITAILTILGFSVHDTIVVFDRTRENLKLRTWKEFDTTVGHSIEQTVARSINTSLTTLVVAFALYLFGGESTKNFALVLAIGITVGTYSSIFLASPLLVAIEEWQRRRVTRRK